MSQVRKHLRLDCLRWMAEGRKTTEGRLSKGYWSTVTVGDHIVFFSHADEQDGSPTEEQLEVEVTAVNHCKDFGDAWLAHGSNLIPEGVADAEEAKKFYREFFAEEQVERCGVVVLTISPCR